MARAPKKAPARRPWTKDDVKLLKGMARKEPAGKIAKALKRTEGATRQKATALGVSLNTTRKAPAKKVAAKKVTAKAAPAKKVAVKKAPAKKVVAKKVIAKKVVAKKAPMKRKAVETPMVEKAAAE
jgi:hypothetical protein